MVRRVLKVRNETGRGEDYAYLAIRSNQKRAADFVAAKSPQPLVDVGVELYARRMVHYYASPVVDAEPESGLHHEPSTVQLSGERMANVFLHVCRRRRRSRWSTSFIVDDPKVHVLGVPQGENLITARAKNTQAHASWRLFERTSAFLG